MRPVFFPAVICTACLGMLTACGSSKSVITGDFTEHDEQFDGATVTLNYFSRTVEEVEQTSSVVKSGTFEMSIPFDEDVPRHGYVLIETSDQRTSHFVNVLIEKNATYTIRTIDEPFLWFRIESDGKYAHINRIPLEDQIEIRQLEVEYSELVSQSQANDQDSSIPPIDDEHSEDTAREPSFHAAVLDWENMSCEEYAGEFESFWDRRSRSFYESENTGIVELRKRLDDSYERSYTQRLQNILNTSSDPVEKLLVLESHFVFELDQRILILEDLETELPSDVVEQRVKPRLERARRLQLGQRNNAALKLGTFIPAFDISLIDRETVPLGSIMQENEIVVLDFWDNYCDRCINAFQEYRSIYSDYVDLGFEVVSLSLEELRDDWEQKSSELDLPWVNAIDPDGSDGALRKLFGVRFPRANFVLDSEGCILKRDLAPDELRDFLGARLSVDP